MKNAPLRASIQSIGYEDADGAERWSYTVTAEPPGAPDMLVSGLVWSDGRGGIEMEQVHSNGLGIPDDLAGRLLIVVYRGLHGKMQDLDGDVAQYVTPDCTGWISDRMYLADASRILRALSRHSKADKFESTLWVSQ